MTNEELNKRLAWFAERGLPYSEKIWSELAAAWDDGYDQHKADEQAFEMGEEQPRANPFRETPTPVMYEPPSKKRSRARGQS